MKFLKQYLFSYIIDVTHTDSQKKDINPFFCR
jgi:hypothetical protein